MPALAGLAACPPRGAIQCEVQPVAIPVRAVYVEENLQVVVDGVPDGLLTALDKAGPSARLFPAVPPEDCETSLRHTALNSRDHVSFHGRFEATVLTNGPPVGSILYTVSGVAVQEEKFVSPEEALTPLVKQLFATG